MAFVVQLRCAEPFSFSSVFKILEPPLWASYICFLYKWPGIQYTHALYAQCQLSEFGCNLCWNWDGKWKIILKFNTLIEENYPSFDSITCYRLSLSQVWLETRTGVYWCSYRFCTALLGQANSIACITDPPTLYLWKMERKRIYLLLFLLFFRLKSHFLGENRVFNKRLIIFHV